MTAALATMSQALTAPYKRGMETHEVGVGAAGLDGVIQLESYDYQAYLHRYGRLPDSPRHLLVPRFAPTEPLDVTVSFRRAPAGPVESVAVRLDAGRPAGLAIPIPTGEPSGPELRLESLLAEPDPPAGAPADNWRVVALLGNLAKLLWILAAEHEELIAHAADVTEQRRRDRARGPSLDLLGADLGVPRFPPAAYSVDDDTIALYHLDDVPPSGQPEAATIRDEVERYRPGHPATNVGLAARSRQPGRFTFGFGFSPEAGAVLSVPDHADFAVPATRDLTFEAMVRPTPREAAALPGAIVAKRDVLNSTAAPGFGLAIGTFRAIDNNIRLSLSDGTVDVTLYADRDLADGSFHHVAGTLERRGAGAMVRLWVDGRAVGTRRVAALGAITSPAALEIGRGREQAPTGGAPQVAALGGVVDEVRLSRVARRVFHPAVGEGDDAYRRRLGIFERWQLPSPTQVLRSINELVQLSRGGTTFTESFVVVEDDNKLVPASQALRVVPSAMARGTCVAADGRVRVTEAEAAGTPHDDPSFDSAWLVRHDDARVVYGDDSRRMMQRGVAEALDALLARLDAGATLLVHQGYDPRASGDLRSIGRALVVTADAIDPERLAATASAAGFDFVCRTVDDRVRLAQGKREALGVAAQPAAGTVPPPASDVAVGDELSLSVLPPLPAAANVRWTVIACGYGAATFVDADVPSRHARGPATRLRATAAGGLMVRVEATVHGHRASGTRTLRIGLPPAGANALAPSAAIGGDGRPDPSEDEASGGREFFHPVYLACHASPNVDYRGNTLNRRMHVRTAAALDRMLAALGAGTLRVERAYDPAAADLHADGRALQLSHASQPGAALAAAAFAAGFDFVRRLPNDVIHVSVAAGELVELDGPADPTVPVGRGASFAIAPQAQPSDVAFAGDGSRAYTANFDSSSVSVVHIPDGPLTDLRRLPVEGVALVDLHPLALAVAPDGRRLWTISGELGTVSAVATQPALAFAGGFTTGRGPVDLAVRPDGTRLYVACAGDSTLKIHDAGSGAQVGSVALPARPASIAVTPSGAQAWVACDAPAGQVVVVDLASNAVSGAPIALPSAAASIAVTPDGATAYVALPAAGAVVPIAVATRTAGAPIPVEAAPTRLAASADGQLVWVASNAGRVVRVVRTATRTLDPARVVAGMGPSGVAVRPAAGASRPAAACVCSDADSQVALLDPSALGTSRSPIALTTQLGAGAGERLQWTTLPADLGEAQLTSTLTPRVDAVGAAPGRLLVRALYVHSGKTNPYQFELRLRPELDHDDVVLRKDQYDIVMNILNTLHPIGVEVRTENVRQHVIEVREGLAEAFPGYTYPNFRTGSIVPAQLKTPDGRS